MIRLTGDEDEYDLANKTGLVRITKADGRRTVVDPTTREERDATTGRLVRVVGDPIKRQNNDKAGWPSPASPSKRRQIEEGTLMPSYVLDSFDPGVGKPARAVRRRFYGGE